MALVWHAAFARAFGVPIDVIATALLVISVWMIYVMDRLLDVRRMAGEDVTARHAFHAKHARSLQLGVSLALILAGTLTIMADERLILFGVVMLSFTGLYGLLVHRKLFWAPKEFLCGGMFSVGVIGGLFIEPFPWTLSLIFGFLCSGNCLVIACAEIGIDRKQDGGALPQRWPGISRWITLVLIILAILSLSLRQPLSMAMAVAGVGLIFVKHAPRSLEWKRVLADVCLLSPLLVWPWL
ncbi:MAG: hypothetical protein ACI8T1_002616 [Verrucomicrobiales bacterium]